MSDGAGDGLCAMCCICCTGAVENWCFFLKCGMGSRTDSGCCASCCKRSFDEDDFEKEAWRARERERAATGAHDEGGNKGVDDELVPMKNSGDVVDAQPTPAQAMEQPRRSSEQAVQ